MLGVFFRIDESSRGVAMKLRVGLMGGVLIDFSDRPLLMLATVAE